nr:MAG TPA: hypothetical protein [Caudoviricetes sp.]
MLPILLPFLIEARTKREKIANEQRTNNEKIIL